MFLEAGQHLAEIPIEPSCQLGEILKTHIAKPSFDLMDVGVMKSRIFANLLLSEAQIKASLPNLLAKCS